MLIDTLDGQETLLRAFACIECGISIDELSPRMFSFNTPYGACPTCDGLGTRMEISPDLVLDKERSIADGGIIPWANTKSKWITGMLEAICSEFDIDPDKPIGDLTKKQQDVLLWGLKDRKVSFPYTNQAGRTRSFSVYFPGVIPSLERRLRESSSQYVQQEIEQYMSYIPCQDCRGARLRPESLAVTVGNKNIYEVTNLAVRDALDFFGNLVLSEKEASIAREILKEIKARLSFLANVGLDYLTLDRAAATLSGGEAQRIRLATQIGSSLMGVLYILDEPSIGLHQRDNERLLETLKNLRDLGNTVIVVEHDEDTIRAADYIVDIGPGAGAQGGEIVATGTLEDIMNCQRSITGQYLSGKKYIPVPRERRQCNGKYVEVLGAGSTISRIWMSSSPWGVYRGDRGVGSGKSTLVNEILIKRWLPASIGLQLGPAPMRIFGVENLDKVMYRSIAYRPHSPTQQLTPGPLMPSGDILPDAGARASYGREDLALTSRAAAVRPAEAMGLLKSRCTSCPMSMYLVKSAGGRGIIGKP